MFAFCARLFYLVNLVSAINLLMHFLKVLCFLLHGAGLLLATSAAFGTVGREVSGNMRGRFEGRMTGRWNLELHTAVRAKPPSNAAAPKCLHTGEKALLLDDATQPDTLSFCRRRSGCMRRPIAELHRTAASQNSQHYA